MIIFLRRRRLCRWLAMTLILISDLTGIVLAAEAPSNKAGAIPIADLNRSTSIDFEKEILPILKNNCLACHNQTKAKADLVLETPQSILKGGESGPSVIPGKSQESLLLKAAAHMADPSMPPRDNKVAASDLTSEELGLLKLWIDQGAKGEVRAAAPIDWKPIPEPLNPIYAVGLTTDGQFAACGRANQIFVYHLPSGQFIARLTDPELTKLPGYEQAGAAHRDMVHSLAFNPDGDLLASGDYRQVKLWRREKNPQQLALTAAPDIEAALSAVSSDGKWLALAGRSSKIQLWNLAEGREAKRLIGSDEGMTCLRFSPDNKHLLGGSADKTFRVWTVEDGAVFVQTTTPAAVLAVAWLADGAGIATGGDDHVIRIWQLPENAGSEVALVKELKGHIGSVTSLDAVGTNKEEIISGSSDGTLRHWNISSGKAIGEMKHGEPLVAVASRSDGKRFASAGGKVAKLWEPKERKLVAELKGDRYAQERVQERDRELAFATKEVDYRKTSLKSAEDQRTSQTNRLSKAVEAHTTAEKGLDEKQKQLASAKDSKAASEKALAQLKAETKKATEEFQAAEKASKQAIADAQKAIEKAALSKAPAESASQTKVISDKVAADAASVAAKTKAAADQESNESAKTSAQKLAADAEAFAMKAKSIAEGIAADAAAKSKAAAEAQALAAKAVEEVASKSFAAGQLKVAFDKVTAENPEKEKKEQEKLAAATKAIDAAEKELKKAELAKSTAENELQLAKASLQQATDSVKVAKAALEAAEHAQKTADLDLQVSKKTALDSEAVIRSIAFSPDHLTLATVGEDRRIHIWSAETGRAFESWNAHEDAVQSVAFAGKDQIVTLAADQKAIVWKLNSPWKLERMIGTGDAASPLVNRVSALRFSPDGKYLATGSGDPSRSGEIKLWDVSNGKLIREFQNVHSDEVFSLDFTADGKYLASGAADKFVKVSEVATGKLVKSFEGHTHHVLSVSWKRDGRTLASAGADNVIKIWDFVAGERKKNIEGFNKEVTSVSFIGITDQAVACSGDNQVRTIKENGDRVRSFDGANDFMYSAAVTPDGKVVIAGGQDSILRVWDALTGQIVTAFAPISKE